MLLTRYVFIGDIAFLQVSQQDKNAFLRGPINIDPCLKTIQFFIDLT